MASSSVPGLDSIRDLFTSAERTVLEATAGRKLVAPSRKQLEKTLALARTLRDKWRDQHAGQARKTKRSAGGAQASSAERMAARVAGPIPTRSMTWAGTTPTPQASAAARMGATKLSSAMPLNRASRRLLPPSRTHERR